MKRFIQQHAAQIIGVLSGWDRLRFRGTLRMLANVTGLCRFLSGTGRGLAKEFRVHAPEMSRQVREQSQRVMEEAGRPVIHLNNPSASKEDLAREVARRDGVKEGPVCLLTAVEGCWSYDVRSNRENGHLERVHAYRKCLHLYHYQIHPRLGFMHTRLQTWLPFNLWVNANGREWLGRQLDAAGIGYLRHENCFTRVDDVAAAQALLDEQVGVDWAGLLGPLGEAVNPARKAIVGDYDIDYYWSVDQSEWATDVMFRSPAALAQIYPGLVRQGIETFSSPEVMRFLGRRVDKGITPRFSGEVTSDLRGRFEGVRVKHRVNDNSVKMYDKAGSVLRVETTLNDVRDLKAPRVVEAKEAKEAEKAKEAEGPVEAKEPVAQGAKEAEAPQNASELTAQAKGAEGAEGAKGAKPRRQVWMPMRKGVADAPRRAEVSQASNGRYLDALAAAGTPEPLKALTEGLSRPVKWKKQQARGLNLLGADDAALLATIGRGEFVINGLRNRDLRRLLFGEDPADAPADAAERKRQSGRVTRKLRMLRAHGLIHKVPHTHRYQVSDKGRQVIAAIQAAREADIQKLTKAA